MVLAGGLGMFLPLPMEHALLEMPLRVWRRLPPRLFHVLGSHNNAPRHGSRGGGGDTDTQGLVAVLQDLAG